MSVSYPPPEQLLPHAPPMVLLDSIIEHSDSHIICCAAAPVWAQHPLRINGELSVFSGVEYAAQALAAHARLCEPIAAPPKAGLLITASTLQAQAQRLDEFAEELTIRVDIDSRTASSSRCQFTIYAQKQLLLSGQLTAATQELL
ncbi:hypothetical protein [Gilvimarinus sp. DA14]|uniref:hypothetical protein n=1 Tax=Gilvimarinus sp. DA14 TaxID=2956798 RepID=UPI0020B880A1|nr:hypothetical protein [Gilvimarinus sp. DA14]UTF59719.1 hypothetical protein NHM04_14790 [Gilvimarinus sp. DA14]